MADTNTRVIIDVTLNSQDATTKANELGASIKNIKDEQKQLKTQGKETDVAFQSNALSLRQLTAEQKAYIAISQAADGSNNQLRAQLTLLTQQYNALGKEERDQTTAGKALAIQIKGISDELKVNEERVGDNRRSVGDYEKANRTATQSLADQKKELSSLGGVVNQAPIGFKILGDQISGVTAQVKNFQAAQNEARVAQQEATKLQTIATTATKEYEVAQQAATTIGFKFAAGEATAAEAELARATATDAATVATAAETAATEAQVIATNSATNATKVFKVALASTGIGAIIVLIAILVNYLKDFDPLVDLVEQLFAGFKAGIDVVGRVIVDFISNIKSIGDLFSKLGAFIAHPIDSFKSLGKEMSEAARAAIRLKAAQQDLNDQLSVQEVINARAQQQIKQLTLESKNRALSEADRASKAKQAQDLDKLNFDQRTKLVDQQLAQAVEGARINGKLSADEIAKLKTNGTAYAIELQNRGKIKQADVDSVKKSELEKIQILDESTGRQEKLQNIQDAAAERAIAAEEKRQTRLAAARKAAADADSARLESLLKTNEGLLTARQNDIASINRDIDEKVAKYKAYGATTEQLEKERTARLLQVTQEFNQKNIAQIQANQKEVEDILVNTIKDEGDRRIAQLQLKYQRELTAADKQAADVKALIVKGETGLDEVLKSITDKRVALEKENAVLKQEAILENYKTELEAFNQHQVDLATAAQLVAGTDAEKLAASQALLDAQYQQQIDNANLTGKDTTLINAQYEAEKQKQSVGAIDATFEAFTKFSTAFQSGVDKNSKAYKIAGAIQAKVDAAQALRNNILIVQENIKALSSQGKLLFPYNIIAIASTLAALAGAVASAKTLVAPVAFATGGVFDSGGRGGLLPGYSRHDNTNAFLRSGEAVIVSEATKDPKALAALNAINVAYGGAPLAPGIAMATGGIAQGGFISDLQRDVLNTSDVINMVVAGVKAAPRPIVDVRTITTAQMSNQIDVKNASI